MLDFSFRSVVAPSFGPLAASATVSESADVILATADTPQNWKDYPCSHAEGNGFLIEF
jgi:hypothetical protein